MELKFTTKSWDFLLFLRKLEIQNPNREYVFSTLMKMFGVNPRTNTYLYKLKDFLEQENILIKHKTINYPFLFYTINRKRLEDIIIDIAGKDVWDSIMEKISMSLISLRAPSFPKIKKFSEDYGD